MNNLPDLWQELDRPFNSVATLGVWRPLLRQLDDFFNDTLGGQSLDDGRLMTPVADVHETEDHYFLSFDMPGVDKDQIDIEVQGHTLVVSGERHFETKHGQGQNRATERRYGKFQRAITLPDHVKSDQVEAHYANGVLTVALPKAEDAKARKVKIGDSKTGLFSRLLGSVSKKDDKDGDTVEVKAAAEDQQASAH